MTREERDNAIAILENEKKCVNRANKNDYCNRDCYNCELVKTDTEILTALDMAIQALEQSMPTMVYPQVDGITPTVVAQANGEYITQSAGDEIRQKNYDLISRQAVMDALCNDCELFRNGEQTCFTKCEEYHFLATLPPVKPQEPKTGQYEKHIDHTDCIWYGSDSGCPVTCSQYRDGWNDAMDYIFKNGRGYQPYRHDG